jgi:hypothetical protein
MKNLNVRLRVGTGHFHLPLNVVFLEVHQRLQLALVSR